MKDKQQLKEFYEKELVGILKRYENVRISIVTKIRNYTIIIGIAAILASLAFAILSPMQFKIYAILPLFAVSGLCVSFRKYFIRSYRNLYKDDIIKRIIKFVEPSFEYEPKQYIDEGLYSVSKLFPGSHNRYSGKDLVKGQICKTKFKFSELRTELTENRDTEDEKPVRTIFNGIFFMGDFNKDFDGYTLVMPKTGEIFNPGPARIINEFNLQAKLVKLEDPEFEKLFAVYGSDQIEARYILTPGLMERIKNYKHKTGKDIGISFVCSFVFVAISMEDEIFEPRLYDTLLDFGPIEEYYDDLMLAVSIIEELNLNLRIWSKQ